MMTQQKQRVWMALSTKLAERVTLSLFIKHLLAQSDISVTPLVFCFLFSFWRMCGGTWVFVCGICLCVHVCIGALVQACACRFQKGNIRFLISYFLPYSSKTCLLLNLEFGFQLGWLTSHPQYFLSQPLQPSSAGITDTYGHAWLILCGC